MNHRKPEGERVSTVCCSVRIRYKKAIIEYVERDGSGTTANVIGKVLEKWVEDNKLLELVTTVVNEEILEFKED